VTHSNWIRLGLVVLFALVSANAQSAGSASREAQMPASQRASASVSSDERRQIAAAFVQERLGVWQERLKLKDWQISIVMARRSDLKPKTLGATHWDKEKKCASISVLDPSEYDLPFRDILNDLELTVVHELVHLDLAALPRSEASRSNEEHAVNRLADALLALDRQRLLI
jgi:hypothetical protein